MNASKCELKDDSLFNLVLSLVPMTQCAQGPLCIQYTIPITDNIFTPSRELPIVSQRVVKPTQQSITIMPMVRCVISK